MKGGTQYTPFQRIILFLFTLFGCGTVAAHEPDLITVHATNSWIRYASSANYECDTPGECWKSDDLWETKVYSSRDGQLHSFRQTTTGPGTISRWVYSFTGTAIYVYAPSREFLDFEPGLQVVCLDGECQSVGLNLPSKNASVAGKPLLIWSKENLASNEHVVEMRLRESGPDGESSRSRPPRGMGFEFLQYKATYTSQFRSYKLRANEEAAGVELYRANSCFGYCPSANYECCTSSKNDANVPQNRRATLKIERAISLSIWGPPKVELEQYFRPYQYGRVEVCLNDACAGLDTFQAYLNVSREKEHLPVLLWSTDTLQPAGIYTVSLKLLDQPHPLKDHVTRQTLQKVVYTEVRVKSLHPVASAQYAVHYIDAVHQIDTQATTHGPSFLSFLFEGVWSFLWSLLGGQSIATNDVIGWWDDPPSWKWDTPIGTYEIKVFSDPVSGPNAKDAARRICIDSKCRMIGAEYTYTKTPRGEPRQPVLLYHATDLDFKRRHSIRVQSVKKFDGGGRDAMALVKVEYKTVTLPKSKPPQPAPPQPARLKPPPPTPTPPIPTSRKPASEKPKIMTLPLGRPDPHASSEGNLFSSILMALEFLASAVLIWSIFVNIQKYQTKIDKRGPLTEPAAPPRHLNRSGGARSPPAFPYTTTANPTPYPGY